MPSNWVDVEVSLCVDPNATRKLCDKILDHVPADGITTLVIDARNNTGGGDAPWGTLLGCLTGKFSSGTTARSSVRTPDAVKPQFSLAAKRLQLTRPSSACRPAGVRKTRDL